MLTPLLLLWPVSLALTWLVAQGIADKPYDRALAENLQALVPFVAVQDERLVLLMEPPVRHVLRSDESDLVFYQLQDARGMVIAGEQNFPRPERDPKVIPGEVYWREDTVRGMEVRVAYGWMPVPVASGQQVLIQVAETRGKRSTLATDITKGVMVPQFIILPLTVLLVWLALVRGIRPLSDLEQRIRARKPDDLSPIDEQQVPQEVAPLVSSINDLLNRLKTSLGTQKRFLADAAHQLKTPLAGLRMQAELAQKDASSGEDVQRSLQQIAKSSVRATHTVNQLLALARAETTGRALPKVTVDMAPLVAEVIADSVPKAMEKQIDLGYEGPEHTPENCLLEGNPTLLRELVRNLVDNALNYTPAGGVVTARVLLDRFSGVLVLQVEDNGPGVPEEERERVLEPFYRSLGTRVDGSGLGMAIVMEIAQQHGAALVLEDTHPGQGAARGLRVSVRFTSLRRLEV